MNWNPNDEETEDQTQQPETEPETAESSGSSVPMSVNELTDELGRITFTEDVLREIVHHAISGIEGLGEIRERGGGFVGIFGGRTKGIDVEMNDDGLRVRMNVTVSYGKPIHEVAREIQEQIKGELERMTGLDVTSVDIYVQNVQAHEDEAAPEDAAGTSGQIEGTEADEERG